MSNQPPPKRFTARRDGATGAAVKDNRTGRIVATFPPDPDHPDMPRKFAEAAANKFNELHENHLKDRKNATGNY